METNLKNPTQNQKDSHMIFIFSLSVFRNYSSLGENLSPSDTGTTSLTVTAVSTDLENDSILLMQSSSSERIWEKIRLSSAANKGDTSLSIDSFNPTYTYDETSRIMLSRETLVSSGGGTPTPSLFRGINTSFIYIRANEFNVTSHTTFSVYTRDNVGSVQPTAYQNRGKIYATTFVLDVFVD